MPAGGYEQSPSSESPGIDRTDLAVPGQPFAISRVAGRDGLRVARPGGRAPTSRGVRDTVFSLVLLSGAAIAWGRPKLFTLALCGVVPALVLRWLTWISPASNVQIWSEIFSLTAVLTIVFVVLAQVFREGPVNAMRVQGAVAAYLLLGVAYAYAYQIDAHLNPAAIASTEGRITTFVEWIYFSFCTLSTVGYGDIVPTSRVSRSLAIAEGISGQLYLAILIARLVTLQVSDSGPSDRSANPREKKEEGV
jgi:hypothetical protein